MSLMDYVNNSVVVEADKEKKEEKQKEKNLNTFVELFSGIGGFRLGLERSGWKCVFANELDKYANKIYQIHFGNGELHEGDIRKIREEEIPDHQMLTAGFPCQSFSNAGFRKGFEDTRGTLFYEICRIAKAKKPKILFLENVRGLLSNKKGETFLKVLKALDELGYDAEWQVINSKYFGVPQLRQRVFIIGHLRGASTRKILPIGVTNSEIHRDDEEVSHCLDATYYKGTNVELSLKKRRRQLVLAIELANTNSNMKESRFSTICHSLDTIASKGLIEIGNLYESKADAGRVYDAMGLARTLKGEAGGLGAKTGLYVHNLRIRKLIPLECERLQSFPDGWTRWLSDTQRYKTLGNAVTVNVIEYLGNLLRECIQ